MITDHELSRVLEEALRERGRVTVPAAGFSMGRRFRESDGLVIEKLNGRAPRAGEVLVFRRFDRWVAHRVVHVYDSSSPWLCLTKGDSILRPDCPPVRKGEAVGVVTALVNGEQSTELQPARPGLFTAWMCRLLARSSGGTHPARANPA